MAAVPDEERLARTRQADRRWLAALLEPCAIALDLGAVETTVTEADVRERDPCRCERRIRDTPPFSQSIRVRTGGVEPPQPLATRLQRAELAGARRPHEESFAAARADAFRDLPRRRRGIPAGGSAPAESTHAERIARRPVGFEPTLRGSRPRMLAVTSRPPREMEGGIGSPQPGAETSPSGFWPRSQLLYLSAVLPASLRRRHPLTGRPRGLVGPAAR